MSTRGGRPLLSREDWTGAALSTIASQGVAGVAVDRLAKELGATRGSFYWHFRDRDELIDAALARWERENTTELIPAAQAVTDPVQRLRYVFAEVYEKAVDPVEITLASDADDPRVAPVFARVTAARLEFLGQIFAELGLPAAESERRAWLTYAFYLGHHRLRRNTNLSQRQPAELQNVVDLLIRR